MTITKQIEQRLMASLGVFCQFIDNDYIYREGILSHPDQGWQNHIPNDDSIQVMRMDASSLVRTYIHCKLLLDVAETREQLDRIYSEIDAFTQNVGSLIPAGGRLDLNCTCISRQTGSHSLEVTFKAKGILHATAAC